MSSIYITSGDDLSLIAVLRILPAASLADTESVHDKYREGPDVQL